MQTAQDIPVLIFADSSSASSAPSAAAASAIASERRINPAWTVATLKTKLLSVTGIPPAAQALTLRLPHVPQPIAIASADEEATTLAAFPLQRYAEIHVFLPFLLLSLLCFGIPSVVVPRLLPFLLLPLPLPAVRW